MVGPVMSSPLEDCTTTAQGGSGVMHILFNAGGILLMVLLGSLLLLRLLSRFLSWETRGMLHLVVLSLPLVISLPLVGGWVHVSTLCCVQSSPYWDHVL